MARSRRVDLLTSFARLSLLVLGEASGWELSKPVFLWGDNLGLHALGALVSGSSLTIASSKLCVIRGEAAQFLVAT